MKFSLAQLQQLAVNAGFPDPSMAASVAYAESGGDTCAQGDPPGTYLCTSPNGTSTSFGLWQIHQTVHPEYDPASLLDPEYNARAALAISQGGSNWQPWTTFRQGLNQPYLVPFAPAPLPSGPAPQIVTPPTARPRAPALLVAASALALAAAAGYAAREERRRRPA